MAGYYDSDDNFATWDAASKGVPGVVGFMYTTWQNRYGDLERIWQGPDRDRSPEGLNPRGWTAGRFAVTIGRGSDRPRRSAS